MEDAGIQQGGPQKVQLGYARKALFALIFCSTWIGLKLKEVTDILAVLRNLLSWQLFSSFIQY